MAGEQAFRTVSFRGAKAAIEALATDVEEVYLGYATDSGEYGIYTNGAWVWFSSAAIESIALSMPAEFTVSGSPLTSDGTITVSKATESANTVWAGPTSGSAAQPSFRALTLDDLPSQAANHVHGLARWTGDGSTTTFDLPDIAEYVELVSNAGAVVDATTYSLSADGTQVTFDAAPTAANVLQANYVIAQA